MSLAGARVQRQRDCRYGTAGTRLYTKTDQATLVELSVAISAASALRRYKHMELTTVAQFTHYHTWWSSVMRRRVIWSVVLEPASPTWQFSASSAMQVDPPICTRFHAVFPSLRPRATPCCLAGIGCKHYQR